ncbi:hypothetical protein [Metabacillus fastidiosus]|uniref:hypothetical protein n=1 Tax=Metabacillus fastidiosus TaxID=1458 RepID=UPI003D28F293
MGVFLLIMILIALYTIVVKQKYLPAKVIHWLFITYIGILLLSAVIAPFLPVEAVTIKEKIGKEEAEQEREKYFNNLAKGNLDEIKNDYSVEEKSFHYKNDTLEIVPGNDSYLNMYVERKVSDDNQIEVFVYMNDLIINGYKITKVKKPYELDLNENILTVIPITQDINISITEKEFPINQITKENKSFPGFDYSVDPVIYMKIPKSLKIKEGDNIGIQEVNK